MPIASVSNKPSQILTQATQLGAILQNTGLSNIYISDTPNVLADSTSILLLPGTPFEWPAHTDLWATCAGTDSSTVAYFTNGAHIGTSVSALIAPVTQYVIATSATSTYISTYSRLAGIYTITCPTTTIATVKFYNSNNSLIYTAVTVSGTINFSLPSDSTYILYSTNTGSNILISILKAGVGVSYGPAIT